MLTRSVRTLAAAVLLALGAPLASAVTPPGPVVTPPGPVVTPPGPVVTPPGPVGPVTPVVAAYVAPTTDEAADMTYMREEEKFARDLYVRFAETWGSSPFAFIASAEQNHMDAMLRLLRKYRLPDPAAGNLVGEFADAELQALYSALLQRGFASELEALKVGGHVEEADLIDLGISIANTTKADIRSVYSALACGSRNHLRAFAAEIRAITGQAYVAQSMPQAAVDAILAQPLERCGRVW